MEQDCYVIEYRNKGGRTCHLSLPIDLYTVEQCEEHEAAIAREGNTRVGHRLEQRTPFVLPLHVRRATLKAKGAL